MISHGKEIKVFSGNSNPELAKAICSHLFKELGECSRPCIVLLLAELEPQ